ncbi:hypothetical protein GCM10010916_38730 [Paenibacillus abyssi]|uniref:Uncharacterized protein n=1 Tax=Paenibacillus abyssi TaxID=1340531 RepID=A0A917G1U2_9BACL|nr:hypothetical protein GCM10010916_38730 [Paenibacillus abyssi]
MSEDRSLASLQGRFGFGIIATNGHKKAINMLNKSLKHLMAAFLRYKRRHNPIKIKNGHIQKTT